MWGAVSKLSPHSPSSQHHPCYQALVRSKHALRLEVGSLETQGMWEVGALEIPLPGPWFVAMWCPYSQEEDGETKETKQSLTNVPLVPDVCICRAQSQYKVITKATWFLSQSLVTSVPCCVWGKHSHLIPEAGGITDTEKPLSEPTWNFPHAKMLPT